MKLLFLLPLIPAVAVVAVPRRKSPFREPKNDLQKSRKARKGLWEALHGLLTPFRDIYPWKAKGFEIGHFSRCFISHNGTGQFWTILDISRQNRTLLDKTGHCAIGGQSPPASLVPLVPLVPAVPAVPVQG